MSSASATRTTPASTDSGSPSERWLMIVCSTSAMTIVRSGSSYTPSSSDGDPVGRQEQAHLLVVRAVDGHAQAVRQAAEHGDHLGVFELHPVVGDHPRLDAGAAQLAQQLQPDVGHDLDVHPRVVVDLQPGDGVDVGGVPQRLQRLVAVHPLDQVAQLAVAAGRQVDPHVAHGFGRRHPRAALGAHADRRARSRLRPCGELLGLGCLRLGLHRGGGYQRPAGSTCQPKAKASWNQPDAIELSVTPSPSPWLLIAQPLPR